MVTSDTPDPPRHAALARRYLALARSGALRARYDAAVTNANNRRHWANADALSADAAASPQVRRTLRNRSRYEVANLSQRVTIPFENGVPAALPPEPLLVEARPISGGLIELEWLYDPALEYLGPGAAHKARIYWDGGTGVMDWSAPHAIVAMNNPIEAARYSWQSGVLTDGQEYRFVVRVATAQWPAGIETDNVTASSSLSDHAMPTAPVLTTGII